MQVTFLGGAEEIGASCAVVDIGEHRLLVDCGQRMNVPAGQVLPDFSLLEGGPPIDAILLTHAHADHIGALPALEPHLSSDCPIYATEATLSISKVMLQDSQRIIMQHRQGEGQLAHFSPAALSGVFARFRSVPWGKAHPIGDVRATWFPAGHILGAAMISIEGPEGCVLFSGDISVSDQRSVPGVFVPAIHPNVLVIESTYGDRMHAHRPTQEKRLVARVARAMEERGHVLFPTFALGRAQEVLIILAEAMRSGDLPEVSVYADGMVRAISRVYNRFPEELSAACRRRWEAGFDPIFPEDLPIYRISHSREREEVAAGPPCVVVASSGMLQGGASQFYAREWIGDSRNVILITGYQDEESPGQALLDLAAEDSQVLRYFELGGVRTEVRCQVESFELSAHADGVELTSVASKLKPDFILPVHGEGGSRNALAQSLMAVCRAEVILPENGMRYDFGHTAPRPRALAARPDPLKAWPPWDPDQPRPLNLADFHAWLVSIEPRIPWITFEELAEIWKSPAPVSDDERRQLHGAVYEQLQQFFVPDAKRPHLLHITPRENLSPLPVHAHREGMPLATSILRELLPASSGLLRFGFFPEEGICRMEFRFPDAARAHCTARLREFQKRTGWTAQVSGEPRDEDLIAVAKELLRIDGHEIHVFRDRGEVAAPMPASMEPADEAIDPTDLVERFHRRTGYRLTLERAE